MKLKETNKNLDINWEITIESDKISKKLHDKFINIAAEIKLPGFRPGKVPLNVIKQRYSKSITPEVLDEIVNDSLKELIKKKNLKPAVQPKIEIKKFEEGGDLVFLATFQIMPTLPDVNLKSLTVEKSELDVTKNDIENSLLELAKNHERFEPLTKKRKSKKGDLILFDYQGKINGKAFEGSMGKDETVVLGSNKYIPGYEDQMLDLELNQEKTISVTFPDDYRLKSVAGKNAKFDVKIKDIQSRVKKVNVDEKLAKELGEKDLETLKAKMKEKMLLDFDKYSALKSRRELTEKIIKKYEFNLPSRMIDDELNFLRAQSKEKKEKDLKKDAERRVKLGLILNKIGTENKVEVTDSDLTKVVAQEAQKYPGEEKKVVEFYKKNPQMLNNLKGIAFEEKVTKYILNSCSFNIKKCTFDELFNSNLLKPEKDKAVEKK